MKATMSSYARPAPVPKMPDGLVELMDGMARDVLLNNPTNVYEFCANHMKKLLEIRDGPSSKKLLTLDQKILKAQEKVRQRAKERREKFDIQIQLRSKTSDEGAGFDKVQTPLIQEDPVVSQLRAPVHHDLQQSSEVEISQDPLTLFSNFSESSKVDELNVIIEDSHELITEDSEDTEKRHIEISTDKESNDKIFGKIDTIPNKKPEDAGEVETIVDKKSADEVIHEKVDTLPHKKPEEVIVSGTVETISDKKPNDEQVFGKVELETLNVEPLKEPETIDIFGVEKSVEAQLQTITEASNESSVSETSISHPIISGDQGIDESTKTVKEALIEEQLDGKNELNKENSVEIRDNEAMKNEMVPENLLENMEFTELTCNESIPPKNAVSVAENTPDPAKEIQKDIIESPEQTTVKQYNESEMLEVSEIASTTIATSTVENYSYDDDIEQAKTSGDNSVLIADTAHNNDGQNTVTPIADASNVGELHNESSKNEIILDHTADEKQNDILASVPIETVTIKSTNIENNVKSDIKMEGNDINVSEIAKETDEIQQIVETHEGNMINENNQLHDSNKDHLLHKSDSIENANEDSISIIESDLSKTDEDSSQNNPNMDLETAAVTIQKVFRSFMFKSRNSTFEDTTHDDHNSLDEDNDQKEEYYAAANLNKERRPLGITRMDSVLQTVNEEKSLSLSTDDSSTLSSAATTIQAHVRGFLVRNKLNSSKTFSMNSLVNSHEVLETDSEQQNKQNKTVLNIHIVPEEGNYLSRDESLITSMDLSLDGSPPSSVNLHPLSCDISERRKMLKREDAVQSVTPPSNNSGKLSEESVKEVLINDNGVLEREPTDEKTDIENQTKDFDNEATDVISSASTVTPTTIITISKSLDPISSPREVTDAPLQRNGRSFTKMSSDESDVITPFVPSPRSKDEASKLVHSGEFHDIVLPTKVSRNDTSVVRGE